jgi:alkanesulfonate monooxygenase SsuD/methylene tetrahydromethanopterin reductase-like flavin-dependent oxidoreductase (luciferase family)
MILGFEESPGFPAVVMPRWKDILWLGQQAEELGFDCVWLPDHLLYRLDEQVAPFGCWDMWSIVAALAATTSRIQIGTMVACTAIRNPALLAKMADTIDEISGGRLILGLGAGYFEPEFRAFGYPFDRLVSRFEEALTIISSLLKTGVVDFQGSFYAARECELRPRGPRASGPPILIGGDGPRLLRLAAQHADLWNGWLAFGDSNPQAVGPLMARVDDACVASGRDPATLGRTVSPRVEFPGDTRTQPGPGTPISGEPHQLAAACLDFASRGISHVQFFASWTPATLETAATALELLDLTSP